MDVLSGHVFGDEGKDERARVLAESHVDGDFVNSVRIEVETPLLHDKYFRPDAQNIVEFV